MPRSTAVPRCPSAVALAGGLAGACARCRRHPHTARGLGRRLCEALPGHAPLAPLEQVASLEVQVPPSPHCCPTPSHRHEPQTKGNVSQDYQHNAVVNVLHGSTAAWGSQPARWPVDQLLVLNEFDCRPMAAGYVNGLARGTPRRAGTRCVSRRLSVLPAVVTSTRGSGSPPLAPSPSQHLRKRSSTALASKRFCMDWQQIHGRLFTVGANVDSMFVWDLQSERLLRACLCTLRPTRRRCARPARDEVALVGFSDGCAVLLRPPRGRHPGIDVEAAQLQWQPSRQSLVARMAGT